MMNRFRFVGLTTLLLISPMPAPGQINPDVRAAEAVVRQAFDAHAAMQWDAAAALMHPDALRRFQHAQIDHQRMRERLWSQTDEERRYPPEMPAEVRAWFGEQQRKQAAMQLAGVAADFAGVSSLAELEALSPEAAFARWLEAHDARTLLVRQQQAMGRAVPPELSLAEMQPTYRIVGSVVESDSTVHVLYRSGHAEEELLGGLGRPSVATVRRSADGWRIWTTQDDALFGLENWVIAIDLPEDRAERLKEIAEREFSWPEGETPRFRASVQGYAGDGSAPEALRLEVLQANGSWVRVDLPYEALMPLWEYLQDWMFLPAREGGVQH